MPDAEVTDAEITEAEIIELDPDTCQVAGIDPEKVATGKARLLASDEIARLTELFKLLGDPTRLRIVHALASTGELCVCDLAQVVDAPETSVSHALRLLRIAGVVHARRDGRMAYYAIDDRHLGLVLDLVTEHLGAGGVR